jgi:hypothetical protein
MGFRVVVMFIGSFMDDFTYVTDVEAVRRVESVTYRGAFAMAVRIHFIS